jgi:hypothetical protein
MAFEDGAATQHISILVARGTSFAFVTLKIAIKGVARRKRASWFLRLHSGLLCQLLLRVHAVDKAELIADGGTKSLPFGKPRLLLPSRAAGDQSTVTALMACGEGHDARLWFGRCQQL